MWLLINNIHKNFEMVKQKRRKYTTQSEKNYAINCAIQGVRLIWKLKIWLAICKFLWSLTNQNAWFVSSFCIELTLFCTVLKKNCTALNQSEWRNFLYLLNCLPHDAAISWDLFSVFLWVIFSCNFLRFILSFLSSNFPAYTLS